MRIGAGRNPPKRVAWRAAKTYAGNLMIGATEKGDICRTAFLCGTKPADVLKRWQKSWPKTDFYKDKKRSVAACPAVFLVGTAFQCAVWRALAAIPFGQTRTYGDIARRIGKKGASRAVGRACGANPVPFFIPCHRVVAANGPGGFSCGLKIKTMLLKKEKHSL